LVLPVSHWGVNPSFYPENPPVICSIVALETCWKLANCMV